MKLKNLLIVGLLMLFVLAMPISPVSAASTNNSTPDLMPNLKEGWAGLPPSVQSWIYWILGVAFVLFVAVTILYTMGGSIKAVISGHRGDVAGRSSGIGDAFYGVGILIVAILAILFIVYIASSV